jgi:tRNA isopentenyl-2-thiomethyl-A-37 hydroxylase MiaE
MYVSGGVSDGSSSLLPPKDHLADHPDVTFEKKIRVECTTIDEWIKSNNIEKVDLLWLDMQGHELNALKAGLVTLEKVQAVYTEVNLKEVYDGAPLYGELREWLEERNFKVEVEEIPWEDGGNVLFVRRSSK